MVIESERGTSMPVEQVEAERAVVAEEPKREEEAAPDPEDSDWVIRRPKRAIITAEESIRRTEDFINNPERGHQSDVQDPESSGPLASEVSEDEWIIRRPKRAKVTAEEATKWTEDFASQRKEEFIASIRKSKS